VGISCPPPLRKLNSLSIDQGILYVCINEINDLSYWHSSLLQLVSEAYMTGEVRVENLKGAMHVCLVRPQQLLN
jgi:hypothetical protein